MAKQFSYNYDTSELSKDADTTQNLDSNPLGITTSEATPLNTLGNISQPVEGSLGTNWDQTTWYDETQNEFRTFDNSFFSNSAPESGTQTIGDINFSDFIRESGESEG